jgi:methyl-accepting chemotaxis protein
MNSHSHEKYLAEFARRAGGLGQEAANIAGSLDDLAIIGQFQIETFNSLSDDINRMTESNQSIHQDAVETERLARETRVSVESALGDTRMLAAAVTRVESGISSVGAALKKVAEAAQDIGQIAFQTRIVAFNASVEAVRAGEAGKGFGVVAEAVKDLAQRVQASSQLITTTVDQLNQKVEALAKEVEAEHGGHKGNAEAAVDSAISAFRTSFGEVSEKIHQITQHAQSNLNTCDTVLSATQALNGNIAASNKTLQAAQNRAHGLLSLGEQLIEITAESGVETEDTPYIETVTQAASEISSVFEEAVDSGYISLNDLFDEQYRPVPGSNPQQHTARFTEFTDRYLPQIQEAIIDLSPLIVFCAAVDRNGYLPTHNQKFSKPQGRNPDWNAANSRNRRIFNDATGLNAGRNQKPFLLQTYRRDMGGGQHVLMKDLSAPIFVKGRHWGGLRLAYKFG